MGTTAQAQQAEQSWKKRIKAKLEPGADTNPIAYAGTVGGLIDERIEQLKQLGDEGDGAERHLLEHAARPALAALIRCGAAPTSQHAALAGATRRTGSIPASAVLKAIRYAGHHQRLSRQHA